MVTKVTSVDGKLSEGSKVSSVRSLACGQATAPREDEQGVQGGGYVRTSRSFRRDRPRGGPPRVYHPSKGGPARRAVNSIAGARAIRKKMDTHDENDVADYGSI